MFGYVIANRKALSEEQLLRYRGCYCGLCRALKERHGELSRMTLNFDMTFLVLMLSSMYEPEESAGSGRCFIHPVKERDYWRTKYTDYAADMNVALAYYNCLDDWDDDRRVLRLTEAKTLEPGYKKASELWPRQCGAADRCMATLHEIERDKSSAPDAAVNCFGELMGELFACEEDAWSDKFRRFGASLGRFIYMMDACVDLDADVKRGRYNPLVAMGRKNLTEDDKKGILTMLIGECAMEFEKFPLIQDVDIMRNVLYCGVWTQYELAKQKRLKGEKDNDK